jgi:hypothetical protein
MGAAREMSVRQDARIMAKTTKPESSASKSIISLKITLRGTQPPVWRRLSVQGGMTLGDLHHAIQAAMGWDDSHPMLSRSMAGSMAIGTPSTTSLMSVA